MVALTPTTNRQTWSTGCLGSSGTWEFSLPVVAGDACELSLRAADGGTANVDRVLEVVGVASNDDCGRASRLDFTSAATATRTLRVRGCGVNAQGSFTLACRRMLSDPIFRNGSD